MRDRTAYDWHDPAFRHAAKWLALPQHDRTHRDEQASLRAEIAADPAFADIAAQLLAAKQSGLDITRPAVMRSALDAGRQAMQDKASQWLDYTPLAALPPNSQNHPPVVYYARHGHLVKIGTTSNIKSRMVALQPQGVLAIEPGDSIQETHRHDQFVHLRRQGEWFELAAELASHVSVLREVFERKTGQAVEAWVEDRRRATKTANSSRWKRRPEPQPLPLAGEALLTAAMGARLAGVTAANFDYWRKTGKVNPVGTDPSGKKLYRTSEVLAVHEAVTSEPGQRRHRYRHVA